MIIPHSFIVGMDITTSKVAIATQPLLSVTVTATIPADVAVKISSNDVPSATLALQSYVYGAVPPDGVAVIILLPFSKGPSVRVTVISGQTILSDGLTVPVQSFASVAVTVIGNVPVSVGVPLNEPPGVSDMPLGNGPLVNSYV